MDKKLDDLLATYTVEDADARLIDKIVLQAMQEETANVVTFKPRRLVAPQWFARAAMMAVVGMFGFWLGNPSAVEDGVTAATAQAATSSGYVEKVIVGPQSLDDVML